MRHPVCVKLNFGREKEKLERGLVRVEAGDFRDELVDAFWHHQQSRRGLNNKIRFYFKQRPVPPIWVSDKWVFLMIFWLDGHLENVFKNRFLGNMVISAI